MSWHYAHVGAYACVKKAVFRVHTNRFSCAMLLQFCVQSVMRTYPPKANKKNLEIMFGIVKPGQDFIFICEFPALKS